ncbi:MAG: HAD family hydrolase [Muribaculaceae bacterium]|nr:HAD family hydrolase [Muribaculaceae bacterium]
MDGTLWDAVDSYCTIWDTTFAELGISAPPVTREKLLSHMGQYLEQILAALAPDAGGRLPELLARLEDNEHTMMKTLGGRLYPGAYETVRKLSGKYKLFMVSNCGEFGLDNFLEFTGLKPFFTDWLTHGGTRKPKAENIRDLVERYNLRRPVYVGDTQGDADQAARAGIEMIFAAYGFGTVTQPDAVIGSITALPEAINILDRKE